MIRRAGDEDSPCPISAGAEDDTGAGSQRNAGVLKEGALVVAVAAVTQKKGASVDEQECETARQKAREIAADLLAARCDYLRGMIGHHALAVWRLKDELLVVESQHRSMMGLLAEATLSPGMFPDTPPDALQQFEKWKTDYLRVITDLEQETKTLSDLLVEAVEAEEYGMDGTIITNGHKVLGMGMRMLKIASKKPAIMEFTYRFCHPAGEER